MKKLEKQLRREQRCLSCKYEKAEKKKKGESAQKKYTETKAQSTETLSEIGTNPNRLHQ